MSLRTLAVCAGVATAVATGVNPSLLDALPTVATEEKVLGSVDLQLKAGTVRGHVTSLGVRRFLGVPFGAPPVGDLRWQPPQPAASWSGVREATAYSKSCPQGNNAFIDVSGISEDCL